MRESEKAFQDIMRQIREIEKMNRKFEKLLRGRCILIDLAPLLTLSYSSFGSSMNFSHYWVRGHLILSGAAGYFRLVMYLPNSWREVIGLLV